MYPVNNDWFENLDTYISLINFSSVVVRLYVLLSKKPQSSLLHSAPVLCGKHALDCMEVI